MRAAFFDRDGTLMEDVHYCADPALVRVYPGVREGLKELRDHGWLVIIVSNQSGIARGLITEEQHRAVHAEFVRQAGEVDAAYYCADGPELASTHRKPAPGMVLEAAAEYGIDLSESWFIGDKAVDVECGERAGTRTIQVLTGRGAEQRRRADRHCANAVEAIALLTSP